MHGFRRLLVVIGFGLPMALGAQPPAGSAAALAAPAPHEPLSPEISAMLAASRPKYEPPKPAPKPVDQDVDLRDVDKPRNGIIRLPKFVVHGERPPVFRERDLYSRSGLGQLALARYQGLSIVPFSPMNTKLAEQMYRDDERLQNLADLKDTASAMARGGDRAESVYILRAAQDTYSATYDWGAPVRENPSARTIPGSP